MGKLLTSKDWRWPRRNLQLVALEHACFDGLGSVNRPDRDLIHLSKYGLGSLNILKTLISFFWVKHEGANSFSFFLKDGLYSKARTSNVHHSVITEKVLEVQDTSKKP